MTYKRISSLDVDDIVKNVKSSIYTISQHLNDNDFILHLLYMWPGLVTLTEMKAKQEDVVKAREKQLAKKDAEARLIEKQKKDKKRSEKMKASKYTRTVLRICTYWIM